jgi:dihydrofolate synthase/folylpolyglutamate synthase
MKEFFKFISKKNTPFKKFEFEYVNQIYEKFLKKEDKTKKIHIVGTNAKGSTGRFLAQILLKSGFKVAHYSSPHIYAINERFWENGKVLDNEILQQGHLKLLEK